MSSRHTPIKGKLTRSFGQEGNQDLVVEFNEAGYVAMRKEPVDRKLKRGEQLPEARLTLDELWEHVSQVPVSAPKLGEVEQILDRLLARLATADLGIEEFGERPHYRLKAWLWQQLKNQIDESLPKRKSCLGEE
jgi:hypothetical protein